MATYELVITESDSVVIEVSTGRQGATGPAGADGADGTEASLGSPLGSIISHTALQDIGTLTHPQLETSLNSKLAGSPLPLYSGSLDDSEF